MDSHHGDEQLALLLDDYQDRPSSSNSAESLPTYSAEKPNIRIQLEDLEIQTVQTISPRLLSRLRDGTGTKGLRTVATSVFPSFVQRSYDYNTELHPTSWLDGLRGMAALFVFIHHFILIWFPALSFGYASAPKYHYFFQLPLLRIIYSGRGMVSLFFVISGYVLSYSTIRKIRAGTFSAVLDTLASSVFRRWLRLFLPILAATFISMLILRMNWYIGTGPARKATFWAQFWDWGHEFVRISDPTQGMSGGDIFNNHYCEQLWTIPREMRGSIVTYLALLCLAKTRQGVRIACMAFFTWYMLWMQQWDLYLFLVGMLLAELDLLRSDLFKDGDSTALLEFLPSSISRYATAIMHTLTTTLALFSLHLLTFPDEGPESTPGYATMIAYTPPIYSPRALTQRYWLALGASLLILSISLSPRIDSSSSPLFQRPFTTRFAQYLGNISFGLYITHYYVVYTVGSRILRYSQGKSLGEYFVGFGVAVVVNSFLAVWVGDLFWRGVDKRSVLVARWVARRCFVK